VRTRSLVAALATLVALACVVVGRSVGLPDFKATYEVLVFPREANGNVASIRVLKGPDAGLGAAAVAVDPGRDLLVVAGGGGGRDSGTFFRIFNRTDQGNVKPKSVIGGPKSGLRSLGGPFAVYPPKGWIVVTDRGEGGLASELL